jgi:putrescine transport system permease protein
MTDIAPPAVAPRRRFRLPISGRAAVVIVPYLWLILFLMVPMLIVLEISFSNQRIGIPPYEPILHYVQGQYVQLSLNLANYAYLFTDDIYALAYISSVKVAFFSTIFCLLLGYPMAYGIARSSPGARTILLMLVIMPFWTSFLIRIYAWIGILKENGLINNVLMSIGIIHQPLQMLYTPFSVYVGMVYGYLPFMILPLYANLEKMDVSLLEAAADLGARPWKTFLTVTLPLSMPGLIAGSLLVFIPACGEYVIPSLLGGPDTYMIGTQIASEFFENRDWPVASAVAITLLVLLLGPIVWYQRVETRTRGGAK